MFSLVLRFVFALWLLVIARTHADFPFVMKIVDDHNRIKLVTMKVPESDSEYIQNGDTIKVDELGHRGDENIPRNSLLERLGLPIEDDESSLEQGSNVLMLPNEPDQPSDDQELDDSTSTEEDEALDDPKIGNSTELFTLQAVEAERTVAFVLITVFSILCAGLALMALIIFIAYYKRNIAHFARSRMFAPGGHRRLESINEVRLLSDDSKVMDF